MVVEINVNPNRPHWVNTYNLYKLMHLMPHLLQSITNNIRCKKA